MLTTDRVLLSKGRVCASLFLHAELVCVIIHFSYRLYFMLSN